VRLTPGKRNKAKSFLATVQRAQQRLPADEVQELAGLAKGRGNLTTEPPGPALAPHYLWNGKWWDGQETKLPSWASTRVKLNVLC
jgi:hypothetical protein